MMPAINQMMLAVSSSLAASMVVKATLLVTLGLVGSAIAGRSPASVRHFLLAATFGVLLLLPVAAVLAPPVRLVVHAAYRNSASPAFSGAAVPGSAATTSSVALTPPQASRLSLSGLLQAAWIGGMALFLAPVILGLWRVHSMRRSALPSPLGQSLADRLARDAGIRRRVEVLEHEDLPGPMTCGVLHPVIVLPRESHAWDAGDLHRALVHELEHVRRADWASQCLARMVCAAYWFHPLVWTAWRRLCLEAERSCDDAVLGGSEATAYANQLVGLARRLSSAGKSPLLAMASRSDLAARVGAVLDNRRPRGRAGTFAVALACAVAAVLVVALSPLRLVAAPQTGPKINLRVQSNLVMVDVVVTDLAGNSIDGLGARDFVISEDGVAQTVSVFEFRKVAMSPETANAPRSYYVLGYYTSNTKQDGQYRKIQVIGKADTTAKLDYRAGYYAGKQSDAPDASSAAGVVPPAAALPPGSHPPVMIFKKNPEYSEEARKAKYQGSVILYVDVDETGQPTNVKVLRSLGLGLDEKAIEAVKQWRFKPGTANGVPVTMPTQVKVDFSLL